ncbi:MAG: CoA-binding protein, partial [Paracoccus denitrificans]
SFGVAQFLQMRGYRVIPVNPGHDGQEILGEHVYASLSDIPKDAAVDMIDIFRRSDAVPAIVDEALRELPDLRTVWMQIGVQSESAATAAQAQGKTVIQNKCPKMEF